MTKVNTIRCVVSASHELLMHATQQWMTHAWICNALTPSFYLLSISLSVNSLREWADQL
jgi:hypothetical protein